MGELQFQEETKGLEDSKAAQIKAVFDPMVKMLEGFEGAYAEVMAMEQSEEKAKLAKRLRLDIAKVRVSADKKRAEQKQEYLIAGNAIQGVYNILKMAVNKKENKLKEVETYYERLEAEKILRVKAERETELLKYDCDGSGMDLGNMADDIYDKLLAGTKQGYEITKEAERIAEQDRLEAIDKQNKYDSRLKALLVYGDHFDHSRLTIDSTEEEFEKIIFDSKTLKTAFDKKQEDIRLENERLKKEADKAEALRVKQEQQRKKEREEAEAKAEKERKANEEKLRIEREAREAAEKKAADEKAESERKEKERLRLEEEKRVEAERLGNERLKKEADEKKKAEMAPDKEKLIQLSSWLIGKLASFNSDEAIKAVESAAKSLSDAAKNL